jgi:hypothetical protein
MEFLFGRDKHVKENTTKMGQTHLLPLELKQEMRMEPSMLEAKVHLAKLVHAPKHK